MVMSMDPKHAAEAYAAYLDGLLPPWYKRAEKYAHDEAAGHANATCRPPTGVPMLDDTPRRLSEIMLPDLAGAHAAPAAGRARRSAGPGVARPDARRRA
jgi:hypothetical protein